MTISFDRVAHIYDATRGLPEDVSEQITDAMVGAVHAGPETRFLELGVGTGRMALPFVRRGFAFTGVDISSAMMDQFRTKVQGDSSNLVLLEGDITDLPFDDRSFDVVLMVHILHLVPDWHRVLDEARRVLAPGGAIILGGNHHVAEAPGHVIREEWGVQARAVGTAAGAPAAGRNAHEEDEYEAYLMNQGAMLSLYTAARWDTRVRPVDLLQRIRNRDFSHTWNMTDEMIDAVHERVSRWAEERYGDLTLELSSPSEFRFTVARWPDSDSA